MTKRGALIGCGFFAGNHMNAWAALDGAEIVALCDRDRPRAEAMARRFGIAAVHEDAGEMFAAERLDFVDIATQAPSHRPLVELAVGHAGLVICQKPFAETMEDAKAMVDAAERAGVPLLVHENFRWQAPLLRVKALMEAGRIGPARWAQLSFRHGYDNYGNQPYLREIERFAIMDVGLHLFDVARSLLGEARDVSCTTQTRNPEVRGEDSFTTLTTHEGGATCICDCTFDARRSPDPFPGTACTVEGDEGSLVLDPFGRLTIHGRDSSAVEDLDPPVPPWGERPWHVVQGSVANLQAHALEVMHGRAEPQPSGADNLRTLGLAFGAYEAAKARKVVTL